MKFPHRRRRRHLHLDVFGLVDRSDAVFVVVLMPEMMNSILQLSYSPI